MSKVKENKSQHNVPFKKLNVGKGSISTGDGDLNHQCWLIEEKLKHYQPRQVIESVKAEIASLINDNDPYRNKITERFKHNLTTYLTDVGQNNLHLERWYLNYKISTKKTDQNRSILYRQIRPWKVLKIKRVHQGIDNVEIILNWLKEKYFPLLAVTKKNIFDYEVYFKDSFDPVLMAAILLPDDLKRLNYLTETYKEYMNQCARGLSKISQDNNAIPPFQKIQLGLQLVTMATKIPYQNLSKNPVLKDAFESEIKKYQGLVDMNVYIKSKPTPTGKDIPTYPNVDGFYIPSKKLHIFIGEVYCELKTGNFLDCKRHEFIAIFKRNDSQINAINWNGSQASLKYFLCGINDSTNFKKFWKNAAIRFMCKGKFLSVKKYEGINKASVSEKEKPILDNAIGEFIMVS